MLYGVPGRIRTSDPLVRSITIQPLLLIVFIVDFRFLLSNAFRLYDV